jgi:Ca2+-binding RTX toxin-like protein
MVYSPRTNEFLVNTNPSGEQNNVAVTRLADGRYLAVWDNTVVVNNATQWVLRGQFYSADGSASGGEMNLTGLTFRGQYNPDVVALPNGGFAISWTQFVSNGYQANLRFFDAAGGPAGTYPLAFNATAAELAALPSGAVVAVWNNSVNFGVTGISGRIVQPDGSGQDLTIPYDGTGLQSGPDVALLANGNFVVTWGESDAEAGGFGYKGQLFSSTGTLLGSEFPAGTDVTALPGGGFVAFSGGNGQIYDTNGGKVGPAFPVGGGVAEVTATENGGFFVTWSTEVAGSGTEVRGQEFAADGTKIGPELMINQATAGNQNVGGIAGGAGSDIFIAWNDPGVGDGSGSAVRGRLYTESVQGSEGAETLTGTPGDDEIVGLGGNDTILAQQGGNDAVNGGAGDDIIYFGPAFSPADRIDGGAGRDVLALQGNYFLQVLQPASVVNVEVLALMSHTDNAYGGADGTPNQYTIRTDDATVAAGQALTLDATALMANESVIFYGQAETDGRFALYGGRGQDALYAGAGADILNGGAGNDTLSGGLGDDIYFVDSAADIVQDGGTGFDAVYSSVNYTLGGEAEIELLGSTASGSTSGIALFGNRFSQTIGGTQGNDTLDGRGGNDYLLGGGGNDQLYATGFSVLAGGTGDDSYFVDDYFQVLNESAGQGFDTVYTKGAFALLGDVEVELLIYQDFTSAGVALYGNGFAQTIRAGTGSDNIVAGGGNDYLLGYAGNDILDGGAGADVMEGGQDSDIYFVDDAGDVVIEIGGGFDSVYASSSYALTPDTEVELLAAVNGGAGTTLDLTGSSTSQSIYGNDGSNRLLGLGGNDFLGGGAGNDTLDGGAGDDILEGGSGADTFRFAATSDTVLSSGDQIRDFVSGTDKIDLSLIDANTSAAGDQAFTYLGTGAFTGQAGQLRYEVANGQVYLSGDTNGDGTADFQIVLNNTTIVAAGDFVF